LLKPEAGTCAESHVPGTFLHSVPISTTVSDTFKTANRVDTEQGDSALPYPDTFALYLAR